MNHLQLSLDDVLENCAQRVEIGARTTVSGIAQAGQALAEARKAFGDNDKAFGQWREKRLPWLNRQSALRWLQVWDKFGGSLLQQNVAVDMSASVLYLLAAPSTPEPVIAQATAKAATGETVTVKDVQEWKAKALQNEKLLRMSEQQRIEAQQALEAEKAKPATVKEIVKEVVPSDYQKLKDDQAALAKALQDTKLVLANVRNEQERLVSGQVQERLDLHKDEIMAMESRRIGLEKAVKELQSQKEKMDARLDSLSHQEHVIDSLKKALFQFSIDIGEISDVSELANKWENLAVQMENGAIVIRHMINGQSEPEEE